MVVPTALEICVQIALTEAPKPALSAVFMFETEVIIATMDVVPPPDDAEEVRAVTTEVNHRRSCRLSIFDAIVQAIR